MLKPNFILGLTTPVFRFERIRLGHKTLTPTGAEYGPYLYRNLIDNTLLSSWEKPTKVASHLYKGEDIGYNTDAITYYKNV